MNDFHYTGDDALTILSQHAPNRNHSIEKLIIKYLKLNEANSSLKILDFGAGKGEFILRLLNHKNLELFAVEPNPKYNEALSKKVKVFNSIEEVPGEMDCIYLIDVLEHIENDEDYLKLFYDKLKIGGRLFIYVPARMELYSSFDKRIGHFRRYSLNELKTKTQKAGFKIEKIRYHELLGYFASWSNKIFSGSSDLNPTAVKIYDKILVPITNFIERFIRFPVGKSIYMSAIRKE